MGEFRASSTARRSSKLSPNATSLGRRANHSKVSTPSKAQSALQSSRSGAAAAEYGPRHRPLRASAGPTSQPLVIGPPAAQSGKRTSSLWQFNTYGFTRGEA